MSYWFFFISLIIIWIIFITVIYFRRPKTGHLAVAILTIIYSLAFDIIFGEQLKLYHYISKQESSLYLLLSGIFLYPLLHIIYLVFLPAKKQIPVYTMLWIAAMLFFEYLSIKTGTIVLTGWRVFPWSIITYVITYLLIITLNSYLLRLVFKPVKQFNERNSIICPHKRIVIDKLPNNRHIKSCECHINLFIFQNIISFSIFMKI